MLQHLQTPQSIPAILMPAGVRRRE